MLLFIPFPLRDNFEAFYLFIACTLTVQNADDNKTKVIWSLTLRNRIWGEDLKINKANGALWMLIEVSIGYSSGRQSGKSIGGGDEGGGKKCSWEK